MLYDINLNKKEDTPMSEDNQIEFKTQDSFEDALTDVLRSGARRLLAGAVETEVEHSFCKSTGMFWTTMVAE